MYNIVEGCQIELKDSKEVWTVVGFAVYANAKGKAVTMVKMKSCPNGSPCGWAVSPVWMRSIVKVTNP